MHDEEQRLIRPLYHGVIGFVLGGLLACGPSCKNRPELNHDPSARALVKPWLSVDDAQSLLKDGELSVRQLVDSTVARIKTYDGGEKGYGAVIDFIPDLNEQILKLGGLERSTLPLYGLPIVVKDNIAVKGAPTTCGSLALAKNIAGVDADLVAQLKAQGAVIVARSNLSEWANFRDGNSTSGWSSVGGQTRNAYEPSRNPCGSSSGSAVAVALGYVPLAVGTETDGSVICPAAVNGVVGIKPTQELISQRGIIPLAQSQDVAGPMARTVRGASLLLSSMVKPEHQEKAVEIRLAGRTPADLSGLRLGVVTNLGRGLKSVDDAFLRLKEALKKKGAILVEVEFPHLPEIAQSEVATIFYEFKRDLDSYLQGVPSDVKTRSLDDLIAFNSVNASSVMPHFGQSRLELANATMNLEESDYVAARNRGKLLSGPQGIDRLLSEHKLSGLMAPSNGPAWLIDYDSGDTYVVGSSTPAAVSGYPAITIPMTQHEGLPLGVSLWSSKFSDARLVSIAAAIEEETGGFKPPLLKD